MTLGQVLYYIVRATQEQYSPYPPDDTDQAAVEQYVRAAGNTNFDIFTTVGNLTFRAFMDGVDIEEQWSNTQSFLWDGILRKTQINQKNTPPNWGPDEQLMDVTAYVAFHV